MYAAGASQYAMALSRFTLLDGSDLRPIWLKARLMPLRVRQSQGVASHMLALPGAPSEVLVLKCKKPPQWVA